MEQTFMYENKMCLNKPTLLSGDSIEYFFIQVKKYIIVFIFLIYNIVINLRNLMSLTLNLL